MPAAVRVLPEALMVNVEYVLEGMVLVSVNVNEPTEPEGIPDISPVDTVIRPELEIAFDMIRELAPQANVPVVRVRLRLTANGSLRVHVTEPPLNVTS